MDESKRCRLPMVVMGGSLIGFILARMGVSASLIGFMERMDMTAWQFLLLANAVLLVLGMFLDGVAMIVLTAPLLFPMATHLGIDPVHFGLIMVLNLMIGLLHPPLGLVLFVLARVSRLSVERTTMAILPWLVPLMMALIAITYIPELTLWLPRQMGLGR